MAADSACALGFQGWEKGDAPDTSIANIGVKGSNGALCSCQVAPPMLGRELVAGAPSGMIPAMPGTLPGTGICPQGHGAELRLLMASGPCSEGPCRLRGLCSDLKPSLKPFQALFMGHKPDFRAQPGANASWLCPNPSSTIGKPPFGSGLGEPSPCHQLSPKGPAGTRVSSGLGRVKVFEVLCHCLERLKEGW